MSRHPRLTLVILLILILAILGGRALAGQSRTSAPADRSPASVRAAADSSRDLRIVISIARRRLWVVRDTADTLLAAPVAVGSGRVMRSGTRVWHFATPRGVRTILSKEIDPLWIRPDWAYIEVAREHGLRLEPLVPGRPRPLSDGRQLVIRDGTVGVLLDSTEFAPLPLDEEIVFGNTLYVPPIGTANRAVSGVLGRFRLNLGGAIGLHGTQDESSIGRAVTHGCLRLSPEPLAWLFDNVPVGTRVYIY